MATRPDGRLANQLRPLATAPAVIGRADGSARFGHASTEVIAAVYGPCEVKRTRERVDAATIEVIVRPRSGLRGSAEREAEQLIASTLQHLVITALHPRTAISVVIQPVCDDGALLSAALNAAFFALMNAGVPMRGMGASCTVAILPSGEAVLDPCREEELGAAAVVTLAYLYRQESRAGASERQLLLSHVRGAATHDQYELLLHAAHAAGGVVVGFAKASLVAATSATTTAGDAPVSESRSPKLD